MIFSTDFISATREKTTAEKNVPAPYLRRDFVLDNLPEKAEITVCGLGFYELFINGKRITRGLLSPYVVNPNQVLPYDRYNITELLVYGENVIAFILGNGMQNGFDGFIWDFQKTRFNSAPKLAFALEMETDGKRCVIQADERVLCHPSPIYFDGLRMGEKYDARREIPNFNLPGCDLSDWTPAIRVNADAGERMLNVAKPVTVTGEMKAVSITEEEDGYLYDFGVNCTGLTRLDIFGYCGQHITIDHGEMLIDGKFTLSNIVFTQPNQIGKPKYVQRSEYICRGGKESYMPTFTYYGFRYAKVRGITKEQATPELLTYVVINTELGDRGDFRCSNERLNTLQEMTRRATVSNFVHFPNDCPHREKNGWTADAALSVEQTMMNFAPEDNYLMWHRCICRAMDSRGAIPGIVPTDTWGMKDGYGYGTGWDSALVYLPYYTAYLRDDMRCAYESGASFMRYFYYLTTRLNERGLLDYGLGDWCAPYKDRGHMAPVEFTDSVLAYDMARRAAYLYRRMGKAAEADFCDAFAVKMRAAIREHLLEDKETMRFAGEYQTNQAMAIFYGICDNEDEIRRALDTLIRLIHEYDDHMTVGVLGARVIFRVLCTYGYEDLAVKMITRSDPPSYGWMIDAGLTALSEKVMPNRNSQNHHFFGDISALMIEYFAGIRINPHGAGASSFEIAPVFCTDMTYAEAYHDSVCGMIRVRWDRTSDANIELSLDMPSAASGEVVAPKGYAVDGKERVKAHPGKFIFTPTRDD